MLYFADLHIHSKYSRATSYQMNLETLDKWAKVKGITVMSTGDFTHPSWFKEISEKLESSDLEQGLFKLKGSLGETRFILGVEISCIYSKGGKGRRVHILIFAPSLEVAYKINVRLGLVGNLKSDGRPILGLDAKELAKIVFDISPDCMVVPAHIWTPWFAVFGSKSGFDSLEECFEEYAKYIYAVETGLSSDPAMNWRVSLLDNVSLISCSDSHSLGKIGREATVFDAELSYYGISGALKSNALKQKDAANKLIYTVEFFPEEGKYHYDGHRDCGISLKPELSKKYNNNCPKCSNPLVIGVLNRVNELADRPEGFKLHNAVPFKSLIPLEEIIADVLKVSVSSKKVVEEYNNLVKKFGNEFNVLLRAKRDDFSSETLPEITEGILRVRDGRVIIEPGYDGVYGKIKIFDEPEKISVSRQQGLF